MLLLCLPLLSLPRKVRPNFWCSAECQCVIWQNTLSLGIHCVSPHICSVCFFFKIFIVRHIWIVALNTRVRFSDPMKALSSMDHSHLSSLHLTCFLGWVPLTSHSQVQILQSAHKPEDYHALQFKFLGFLSIDFLLPSSLPWKLWQGQSVLHFWKTKLSQPVQSPHIPSTPPSWSCLCLADKNL